MKLYRDFTSQEEIDLEYNMAITVPDTKRWMEKVYVQESAKVRQWTKRSMSSQPKSPALRFWSLSTEVIGTGAAARNSAW